MNRPPIICARQSGSAVLAALGILAVTLVMVSVALTQARHRFQTSHYSSRWSQAEQAAEAGAELALMTAQRSSWTADGWPSAPGEVGAPAVEQTFTLSTDLPVSVTVAVDQVAINSVIWLRIRSRGKADVSGGAVAGIDPQDVRLRKLSLRYDRADGTSVGASPRTTRTVAILAEPVAKSPYKMALLMNQKLVMSGGSVDSFDSSDPTKSTTGLYDIAKRQTNGDVAINDTQGVSDLGGAYVYGDVTYAGGTTFSRMSVSTAEGFSSPTGTLSEGGASDPSSTAPTGTANVQGTVSSASPTPVVPVLAPTWTAFNATPTAICNSMSLTGGTKSAPARYKVSSVSLPVGKRLTMCSHATGAESYIEVWVTGNFTATDIGSIQHEPGVHVIYHVEGDVTVNASSFANQSNTAANNVINVINPAEGVSQTVNVSGSGAFIGAINAPGAAVTVSDSTSFSGGLIGKTMNICNGASIHYDEALGRAGIGPADRYRVGSWVEAVR
ncbi:MAG: hypothetical protein K8R23_04625 [Chthoniobacter sp.]|nr:hypothetical protein [Chthoniobacter sp.]